MACDVAVADAGTAGAGGKAPGDWRTPRRFAHAGAVAGAPASGSEATRRRFLKNSQNNLLLFPGGGHIPVNV